MRRCRWRSGATKKTTTTECPSAKGIGHGNAETKGTMHAVRCMGSANHEPNGKARDASKATASLSMNACCIMKTNLYLYVCICMCVCVSVCACQYHSKEATLPRRQRTSIT